MSSAWLSSFAKIDVFGTSVRLEVLYLVQLREDTAIIRSTECLEFLQRLSADVGTIDLEQHPLGARVLYLFVYGIARRVSLACPRCHLNQVPAAFPVSWNLQVLGSAAPQSFSGVLNPLEADPIFGFGELLRSGFSVSTGDKARISGLLSC